MAERDGALADDEAEHDLRRRAGGDRHASSLSIVPTLGSKRALVGGRPATSATGTPRRSETTRGRCRAAAAVRGARVDRLRHCSWQRSACARQAPARGDRPAPGGRSRRGDASATSGAVAGTRAATASANGTSDARPARCTRTSCPIDTTRGRRPRRATISARAGRAGAKRRTAAGTRAGSAAQSRHAARRARGPRAARSRDRAAAGRCRASRRRP